MSSILQADINVSTNGDNTLVAAVTGKIIRVLNYVIVPAATVTVKVLDGGGAGAVLAGPIALTTQGLWPGWVPPYGAGYDKGHFETSAGNALVLNLSAGTQVGGYINYRLVDT